MQQGFSCFTSLLSEVTQLCKPVNHEFRLISLGSVPSLESPEVIIQELSYFIIVTSLVILHECILEVPDDMTKS